jgi:hypothetical protein
MNAIDDNHDNDDYLQGFCKELFKRDYFIRSLFVYLSVFLYQFHLFLYFFDVFTFEVPDTLYSIRTFSLIMSLTKSSNDLNPSFSEITIAAVLKFFDNLKTIGISISWSFQYHSCCFCNFYSLYFLLEESFIKIAYRTWIIIYILSLTLVLYPYVATATLVTTSITNIKCLSSLYAN